MIEIIITSSALIAIVILLRAIFKNSVSRRFRYALWGVVLLRLLVPVQFFESPVSILNAVDNDRVENAGYIMQDYNLPVFPIGTSRTSFTTGVTTGTFEPTEPAEAPSKSEPEIIWFTLSATQIMTLIWFLGALGVAIWFVVVNSKFKRTLRNNRIPQEIDGFPLPVYLVNTESSPCLYGLFKPAVYITPKATEDDETLKYVLAHELTHYRHLDHIWAFLRIVCLCAYWFNPLVWVAAWLSRVDCEQACDESVVKQIGADNRTQYGRSIVNLISVKPSPDMIICTATTMAAGKNSIKKRITAIAANRKTAVPALIAVVLLVVVAVGCTFAGAVTANFVGNGVYTLELPKDYIYERDSSDVNLYKDGDIVGGVEHLDYENAATLLQDPGNWRQFWGDVGIINTETVSFMGESSHYANHELSISYVGSDTEYKHFFFIAAENAVFDLWFDTSVFSNREFTATAKSFEIVGDIKTYKWSDEDIQRWQSEVSFIGPIVGFSKSDNYDAIGSAWAQEFVKKYVENTSEDSPLHSTDAAVLSVELYSESVITTPKSIVFDMRFACEAVDPNAFEQWYVGLAGPINSIEYPQYEGWMEFGWFIVLTQTADGIWYCSDAGTGGYAGAGYLLSTGANNQSGMFVSVTSAGETIIPYSQIGYERTWTDSGWLHADGKLIDAKLIDEIKNEIPTVVMARDFNIAVSTSLWQGLSVYDADFENVLGSDAYYYGFTAVNWLSEGEYYCLFGVYGELGDYVPSEGAYEESGYHCLFRLVVDETWNVKPLAPQDAHSFTSAEWYTADGKSVTGSNDLKWIEEHFSTATELPGGAGCPFGSVLYLTRADGSVFAVCPAEDSCDVFFSGGLYFSYGSGDNSDFCEMFGVDLNQDEISADQRDENETSEQHDWQHISFGMINSYAISLEESEKLSNTLLHLRPGDTTINVCLQYFEWLDESGRVINNNSDTHVELYLYKYDEQTGSELIQQLSLSNDLPKTFTGLSDTSAYYIKLTFSNAGEYTALQIYRDPNIIDGIYY